MSRIKTRFEDSVNTASATVQDDLFDPDRDGNPGQGGSAGGERTRCGDTNFGKTVWYDLRFSTLGGVQIVAAGFDVVLVLYEWDRATSKITRRVQCENARAADTEQIIATLSERRNYTLQVGGVERAGRPASGKLTLTVDFFADRDDDGVFDELDRCPGVPGPDDNQGCPTRR